MSQIEHKAVYGLELQSNSFSPREGSLEVATNIVVAQDNIYSKRRGFKTFVDATTTVIRKITSFQDKLLGISNGSTTNKVQVYNQSATGAYSSTTNLVNETGLTWTSTSVSPDPVESNGNLYFPTDGPVLKLENTSGSVLRAGIDEATDLTVFRSVFSKQESYLRPDSQIGFRILFGRKDANQNKILGAPSEFAITTNSVEAAASLNVATAFTVKVTTTSAHGFSGTPNTNFVYISGAVGAAIPDGVFQLTSIPGANEFWFSTVDIAVGSLSAINWGSYKNVKLEFDLPDQIQTTEYFYQIYRTTASAGILVDPDESTLQLVDELNVTAGEIAQGFVTYYDITPDILRGAYLYTNPNTGEPRGIAEANVRPPQCQDMEVFKESMFYAAPTSPYRLALALVTSTTTTMPDACEFTIQRTSGSPNLRTFTGYAATDVGNRIVQATSTVSALNLVTINYTAHGFSSGDVISVVEAVDSSEVQLSVITPGSYTVTVTSANQFTIPVVGTPAAISSLSFAGLSASGGDRMFYISQSDASSTTDTVSSAIDTTARAIVRAINRDGSGDCIAFYTSSPSDVPGKTTLQSKTTTTNFKVNAITSAIVDSFLPQIATTGSLTLGIRDEEAGVMYVAKRGQPEAVPLANKFPIGSKTADIIRIKALKDSLIVIKKDGIFRVNGSDINSFTATILDSTVTCKASGSVVVLNNQVYMLSEQGIVAISETSVAIRSRQIEPLLTAIVGKLDGSGDSLCESQTHAVGYESERLFIMTTISPTASSSDTADTVYVYNELTNAWTKWTTLFADAYNNPKDDKLYYLDMSNVIQQEKKSQDRLDYTDSEYATTVLTVPTTTTATLSVVGANPAVGDIFVKTGTTVINRITAISGSTVTFARAVSFSASDTGTLYKAITSVIRPSPETGGDTSRWKQFSEFKASFRNASACSRMSVYFLTDDISGSESTDWQSEATASTAGWGDLPWGSFPWGQEEGTNTTYETSASQPMRVYVPLEAQRGTYIQAHMEHSEAAENIAMQSMAYTARIYGQRTTK